jgi:predicted nucleic acid-binding protein
MEKVYLETTIPSYLTGKLNRDIVVAAQQQATREWWETVRFDYELLISEAVVYECNRGDRDAVSRRLSIINGLSILKTNEEVERLAEVLFKLLGIPEKSKLDAVHLAFAVVFEINYLLTWNCKHLAHGEIREQIHNYCLKNGLFEPMIVTPFELMRRD